MQLQDLLHVQTVSTTDDGGKGGEGIEKSSRTILMSSSSSNKLTITNLSHTIQPSNTFPSTKTKTSDPVRILDSISFTAKSSQILAIVGPSGAGKSTLLRILSGRLPNVNLDPKTICLNQQSLMSTTQLRKLCGFVTQNDNLLPLLTVRETLLFSSWFCQRGMSKGEREQRVDALIEELGLVHVAQSYVGDEEIRGVSGGERRRVSIGVDVIHDPPILLLDEPTSGLDSSTALHVVALLATMAQRRNQIVILTIHQPSYRILEYISYFLLLTSSGNVAHSGSLRCLEKTIKKMDLKVPIQLNALEFAMEIPLMAATRPTLEDHLKSPMIFAPPTPASPLSEELILKKQSRYSEITHLSWRFWRVMYRTKQLFLSRIMQALVGGFGLGSVYLHIKQSKTGVTERLGLFAFTLSFLLSSTVEALPIFLQERRVLMRESSRSMYRLSSYMIANTLIFMPFLLIISIIFSSSVYWLVGLRQSYTAFAYFTFVVWLILLMASSLVQFLSAISPDFILGNSLISTSLGVFFLFSGYFIPKSSIPRYWMFMYYVSPYRYPLDSLLVNEYWGMKDVCFQWVDYGAGPSKCGLTGSDVLTNRGLDRDCRWENVWIMLGFFMFYRFLSWIVLIWKASRTMH